MDGAASQSIERVIVLGGGSAGFIAALTLQRRLPGLQVTVVRSTEIPLIGVGEATLASFPTFLHDVLALDRRQFYADVRPIWKLGVRFHWGRTADTHFNYPFGGACLQLKHRQLPRDNAYYCLAEGLQAANQFAALMDACRSPVVRVGRGQLGIDHQYGYHIENGPFVDYLERVALERGVRIVEDRVVDVQRRSDGGVSCLECSAAGSLDADLFVDCSGFRSRLLGECLQEPFLSYQDSLTNNMAVTGNVTRSDAIRPFTTARTMNHGWSWRIDFEQHVSRGYVFNTSFCDVDRAADEICQDEPALVSNLREVPFRTGRYQRFWVHNVAAIGNASGFVEPLQSTGLEMIAETALTLARGIADAECRPGPAERQLANDRIANRWEDIRGFLSLHFRYNRARSTPYWQHCQDSTHLAAAAPLVATYRQVGPSRLAEHLLPQQSLFGYDGYLVMLVGLAVPTACTPQITPPERQIWQQTVAQLADNAQQALTVDAALAAVHDPRWQW